MSKIIEIGKKIFGKKTSHEVCIGNPIHLFRLLDVNDEGKVSLKGIFYIIIRKKKKTSRLILIIL
jgi:hypothetical protein